MVGGREIHIVLLGLRLKNVKYKEESSGTTNDNFSKEKNVLERFGLSGGFNLDGAPCLSHEK